MARKSVSGEPSFQENIPGEHMKLADLFVKKSKDKLLDKHFLVYDDRMICA